MTMEIIWHDPPPSGRVGKHWNWFEEFANGLRENPNQWGECPPNQGEYFTVSAITALKKRYPDIKWTSRPTNEKNRVRIWGRFEQPDNPNGNVKRPAGRDERIDALQRERRGAAIS